MQFGRKGKRIFSLTVLISILTVMCQWARITTPVSAAAQSNQQAPAAQSNQKAQIEKGRLAVGQACAACHGNILSMVQFQRKSEQQWRDTVYGMIGRGGHILPGEIEPITAYLTANFGPNSPPPSSSTRAANTAQPAVGNLEQQLPDADGKPILVRTCQQCHDLQIAIGKTGSQEEWKEIIGRMVTFGATVTPAEQEKLTEYLSGLTRFRETR